MTYNNSDKILLQSLDGTVFETNIRAAMQCGTIRSMLEKQECMQNAADGVIPLMRIHSNTLQKIIQWADHHQDDEREADPVPSNHVPHPIEPLDTSEAAINSIEPWDADFMADMDQNTLTDILLASNYLDIRGLMRLACLSVAKIMLAEPPDYNEDHDVNTEDFQGSAASGIEDDC